MKYILPVALICCFLLTSCRLQEHESHALPPAPSSTDQGIPATAESPIAPPPAPEPPDQRVPNAPPPPPPPPMVEEESREFLMSHDKSKNKQTRFYEESPAGDELSTTSYKRAEKKYSHVMPGDVQTRNAYNNNSEEYSGTQENKFISPIDEGLSTFSIDVDKAAYSNVRRFLTQHRLPPKDAIRLEEMINYFHYDLPQAKANEAFAIDTEYGPHPWLEGAGMLRVSMQGKKDVDEYKGSNLVFLLDVSGSMNQDNKLPLLKRSFHLLLDQLDEDDMVSIVVYAGGSRHSIGTDFRQKSPKNSSRTAKIESWRKYCRR